MFSNKRFKKERMVEALSETLKDREDNLIRAHLDWYHLTIKYPDLDEELTKLRAELSMRDVMVGQEKSTKWKEITIQMQNRIKELDAISGQFAKWKTGIEFNEELIETLKKMIKDPVKIYEQVNKQIKRKDKKSKKS